MASIHFLVLSDKNPANIYVRVRDTKRDAKVKTALLIDPAQWSHAKKQPKNLKDARMKALMAKLNSIVANISAELSGSLNERTISKEWLEEILNRKEKKNKVSFLSDYFEVYYEKKERSNAKLSYLKKVKSVKNLILGFQKAKRRKIEIINVDHSFAEEFVHFMNNNGYRQTYTYRVIKFIKTVCKDAQKSGIEVSKGLDLVKTQNEKAYKVYLTPEELEIIKNAEMPSESLSNARDWLYISCFLGQRVSDLLRCSSDKIKKVDGGEVLDLTQKKTEKAVMVAILPEVTEILSKRNGQFPYPISSQKYNDYIKQVCRIAGLNTLTKGAIFDSKTNRKIDGTFEKWQLISSHVGRRSFATNYYGKYSTTFLMAQTGHTSERSFLTYIGKGRIDQISQFLKMIHNG